jgi:hypothetical protein
MSATMILTAVEFPMGAAPDEVPEEVVRDLGLVFVPVLMIVYMIALFLLTGYRISRESHGQNLQRLAGAPSSE